MKSPQRRPSHGYHAIASSLYSVGMSVGTGTSHQWLHQWLYDVHGSNHMCTQICMYNLAMEVILANMVQIKFHRHSVSVLWGIYTHHVSLLDKVARRFQKLTSYVHLYRLLPSDCYPPMGLVRLYRLLPSNCCNFCLTC